jgi:hypothetical protein
MAEVQFNFWNVNEETVVYDRHDSFEGAKMVHLQFPNDIIIATVKGSHADIIMAGVSEHPKAVEV